MYLFKTIVTIASFFFIFYTPELSIASLADCESSLNSQNFQESIYENYLDRFSKITDRQRAWASFVDEISSSQDLWVNEKVIAFLDAQYLVDIPLHSYIKAIEGRLKWKRYPSQSLRDMLSRLRHPWLTPGVKAKGKHKIYSNSNVNTWTPLKLAKYSWQLSLAIREITFRVSYMSPFASGPSSFIGNPWQENLPGLADVQHWQTMSLQQSVTPKKITDDLLVNNPAYYADQVKRVWQKNSEVLSELYGQLSQDVLGFADWERTLIGRKTFLDTELAQESDYQNGPLMRRWYWQNTMRVFIFLGLINTLPYLPEAVANIDDYYKNGLNLITGLSKEENRNEIQNNFKKNMVVQVQKREKELQESMESLRIKLIQQGISERLLMQNKDYNDLQLQLDQFQRKYKAYLQEN